MYSLVKSLCLTWGVTKAWFGLSLNQRYGGHIQNRKIIMCQHFYSKITFLMLVEAKTFEDTIPL